MRKTSTKKLLLIVASVVLVVCIAAIAGLQNFKSKASATEGVGADTFSWDNASVYFLLTDRFFNGKTSNDHSYNRGLDQSGNVVSGIDQSATFHGGDFVGITKKIEEGYFDKLGINALWVSAPYEQIHGYVVGGDGTSFAHYAYHGYYALDYTSTDANFGTADEFKTLVDTAHEHGIRIVIDVVLNHSGYNTLYDMNEYGFGTLKTGWQSIYYPHTNINNTTYHSYIDYTTSSSDWAKWWGTDWIRAGIAGYSEGSGNVTGCLAGLPDFKTETTNTVGVPTFLKTKWAKEGRYDKEVAELNSYYASSGKSQTVTNTLAYWLSTWVRDYGVDGFRCDTAKHVELASWKNLKTTCVAALKEWKAANPDKALDNLDFWMTGECWDHGMYKDSYFTEGGFDSMINFNTQGGGILALSTVGTTYNTYATTINSDPTFNVLSYISSHDSVLTRGNSIYMGSSLLLLPGGVQVFYGDETDRPVDSTAQTNGDHEVRCDMNWSTMNTDTLSHWQKIGTFRKNHISVGGGFNATLTTTSGYAFSRIYDKNNILDKVAACIGATANTDVTINVSTLWADGQVLVNAYDSTSAIVADGKVTFNSGKNGTILIQIPDGKPLVTVSGGAKFYEKETVTLNLDGADQAKVSVDGAKKFYVSNGGTFEIGTTAYEGDTVTVVVEATNAKGTVSSSFSFYKAYRTEDITTTTPVITTKDINIHVKTYDGTAPYMYVWDVNGKTYNGGFPGKQVTTKDSDGNYVFTTTVENLSALNCIVSKGSNQNQTSDITGITDGSLITITTADGKTYEITRPVVTVSGMALLKQETRAIKNMSPENYTSATWTKLNALVASADAIIALGTNAAEADITAKTTEIKTAKAALVIATPSLTKLAAGSTTIKGLAAYGSTVTVTVGSTSYTATADDVTGVWTVTASSVSSSDTVKVTAKLGDLTSGTYSYALSNGPIDIVTTEPPITTAGPTTAPPVSTAPVTTAPPTTVPPSDSPTTVPPTATPVVTTVPPTATPVVTTAPPTATPVVTTAPPSNSIVIYYYTGWTNPYIHYKIGSGSWTTAPGVKMEASGISGYGKAIIDLGTATTLTACFNNGSGTWDNNSSKDYFFSAPGTYTVKNATITSGEPVVYVPDGTITVYYYTGWTAPYIHFKLGSGTWTTVPGIAMTASNRTGYSVIKISLGTATNMTACFNNGSGSWDNNGGKNYYFGSQGIYTLKSGVVTQEN